MNIVFFDSETDGIIRDLKTSTAEFQNWPKIAQLSWMIDDENGNTIKSNNFFIDGNHIKHEYQDRAEKVSEKYALNCFMTDIQNADLIVAHNYEFDFKVIDAACNRLGILNEMIEINFICTMKAGTRFCNIQTENGIKYPTLIQLFYTATKVPLITQHEALADTIMLKISFWQLLSFQVITIELPQRDRNMHIVFIEKLNKFIPYFCYFFFHKSIKLFYEAILVKSKLEVSTCSLNPLILADYSEEDKLKIIRLLKNFEKQFPAYQRKSLFSKYGEIISDKYGFDIFSNFYSNAIIQEAEKIDDTYAKIGELESYLIIYFAKFGINLKYLNEQFAINNKKTSGYEAFNIFVAEFYETCLKSPIKIDFKKIYDFIALKQITTFFLIVYSDIKKGKFQ